MEVKCPQFYNNCWHCEFHCHCWHSVLVSIRGHVITFLILPRLLQYITTELMFVLAQFSKLIREQQLVLICSSSLATQDALDYSPSKGTAWLLPDQILCVGLEGHSCPSCTVTPTVISTASYACRHITWSSLGPPSLPILRFAWGYWLSGWPGEQNCPHSKYSQEKYHHCVANIRSWVCNDSWKWTNLHSLTLKWCLVQDCHRAIHLYWACVLSLPDILVFVFVCFGSICMQSSDHKHKSYSITKHVGCNFYSNSSFPPLIFSPHLLSFSSSPHHHPSTLSPSSPTFSLLCTCPLSPIVSVPTVELLYDAKVGIGEGPFYEAQRNQLLWVDISGCSLNFLDLETRENRWKCSLRSRRS